MKVFITQFTLLFVVSTTLAQSGLPKRLSPDGIENTVFSNQYYEQVASGNLTQPVLHSRGLESQLDSAAYWEWDVASADWLFDNVVIYTYHNDYTAFLGLDQDYQYQFLDTLFYDQDGRPARYHSLSWNGSEWETSYVILYTLTDAGMFSEILFLLEEGGTLVNDNRSTYHYDANGYLVERVYYTWNDAWVETSRTLYENTPEGLVTMETVQEWTGTWENSQRTLYTYGANQELVNEQLDYWYGFWEIGYNTAYTYNDQQLLAEALEGFYLSGTLYSSSRVLYSYDDAGNLLEELYQSEEQGEWINTSRNMSTFDSENNETSRLYQQWDETWVNTDSAYYYYSEIVSVAPPPAPGFEMIIYPNPTTGLLQVKQTSDIYNGYRVIELPSGQIVRTGALNGQIDISLLSAGLYVLQLNGSTGWGTQNRFVKL
jgi:hypothetical protein